MGVASAQRTDSAGQKSYDDFEFHTIFHALNNFCSVDLSAVYLDILKDRLYTFRADSPLRRGSQTVLFEIVVAMTKLMAPVLSFTAEEIWRTLAAQPGGRLGVSSVHLSAFPEGPAPMAGSALAQRWERLLGYRTQVQGVLEGSRRDKTIGSSLEATVELRADADTYEFLQPYRRTWPRSSLCRRSSWLPAVKQKVSWRLRRQSPLSESVSVVGTIVKQWARMPNHPTLCDRCVEAVQ